MNPIIFFTPASQVRISTVECVILTGMRYDYEWYPPQVTLNSKYEFSSDDGQSVIDQLHSIGFYNSEKYKIVSDHFKTLMKEYLKQKEDMQRVEDTRKRSFWRWLG